MIKFLIQYLILNILLFTSSLSEIIKDINIEGNKRISYETVLVLGDIKIGTDYNSESLNEIIKKLYDTEFFEDISINLDNNTLTVNLIENPIIEDIAIEGIKSKRTTENLLDAIDLKKRKSFMENL